MKKNSSPKRTGTKRPKAKPPELPEPLSTRNLERWPSPRELRRLTRTLAVLSLAQGHDYHVYERFPGDDMDVATMRNGSGDQLLIFFHRNGTLVHGFSHEAPGGTWGESPRPWRGVLAVPRELQRLKRTQLPREDVSFCVWSTPSTRGWQCKAAPYPESMGEDPDGSAFIMERLPRSPEDYLDWATHQYEHSPDPRAVRHVFAQRPLTDAVLRKLNPDCELDASDAAFRATGYPRRARAARRA